MTAGPEPALTDHPHLANPGAPDPDEPDPDDPTAHTATRHVGRVTAALVPGAGVAAAGALGFLLGTGATLGPGHVVAAAVLLVGAAGATALTGSATAAARPRPVRTELLAVHTAAGVTAPTALRLAGAVTTASAHPLAQAVTAAAVTQHGTLPGVAEPDPVPGLGVRGVVAELADGTGGPRVVAHAVLVGRLELLHAHGIALPDGLAAAHAAALAAGRVPVTVAWDGAARAVLVIGRRRVAAARRWYSPVG